MYSAALMIEFTPAAEDTFHQVVRRREAQLLRIAYRILGNWADAEDVAQEAFLRLYKHGIDFPGEDALGAWLYRVTVNLCVDRHRGPAANGFAAHGHVANGPAANDDLQDLRGTDPSAEAELLRDEQKRRLTVALATLPAKERAALVLREIEGLPTAQVAAILGSSEGTIRSQISKAMTKLRTLLTKEGS